MDVKTDNFRLSCVKALHWLLLRYMEATLGSGGRIKTDQGRVEKWYTKGIWEQKSTDVLFLVFFKSFYLLALHFLYQFLLKLKVEHIFTGFVTVLVANINTFQS